MADLPSLIDLPYRLENAPAGQDNSDQFPESLPRYFIDHFTKKGDKVFDPFLGFGTTAFSAEKAGRLPYGIEADRARFEWAAGQLTHWNQIIHGDSALMNDYKFPKMDFCFTSPPYMPCHHKWNPLYGGDPQYAGYDCYLAQMGVIFAQLARVMKKNSYIVVQADNLPGKRYTPLVRDLSLAISKSFQPRAESIIKWKNSKSDYPYTHCLVFKAI